MSILKVANVHFESTGTVRIDYTGNNVLRANASAGFQIPSGSSAGRTTDGSVGVLRYNTDLNKIEVSNGSSWTILQDANTTTALSGLTVSGTYNDAGANAASQTLTDGATVTWDTSQGRIATLTLGGNRTLAAPTNLRVGVYILYLIQDATGSRTVTWNSVFKWPGGVAPTLTTTASAKDLISFISDGTNLYGTYMNDVK
jgi:hypothetical protein